jgi:MoaA/NifB/PqqE/SkfB family radical SAM enzyme
MILADWCRVLDEAANIGVDRVQLIGGEPTLHPRFSDLVRHALSRHLDVEIYSNLARSFIPEVWNLFEQQGVRLATSYYSDDAIQHDRITCRPGSHSWTLANIQEALRRGIPIRAGVIEMEPGQRVHEAVERLHSMGVSRVDFDKLRQLGRGVHDREPRQVDQLCGGCGNGRLAVSPTGEVWPCPMSRWISLGNVTDATLADIYYASAQARHQLQAALHEANDDKDGGCAAPLCCDPVFKK